jgi:hypothetical protein
MFRFQQMRWAAACVVVTGAVLATNAQASPIVVPLAAFGAPAVTFSEVPLGTPLNGLTINGFSFTETVVNTTVANGGPGDTNSITQPAALGAGNPQGEVITVNLPSLMSDFGFGYAILAGGVVPNAVTVTLFNGATNLGSLSYTASPDPNFPGGFAGIGNATPFDRVTFSFTSTAAAYDFDNIRAITAVPEPATLTLVGAGVLALARRRRAPRA